MLFICDGINYTIQSNNYHGQLSYTIAKISLEASFGELFNGSEKNPPFNTDSFIGDDAH